MDWVWNNLGYQIILQYTLWLPFLGRPTGPKTPSESISIPCCRKVPRSEDWLVTYARTTVKMSMQRSFSPTIVFSLGALFIQSKVNLYFSTLSVSFYYLPSGSQSLPSSSSSAAKVHWSLGSGFGDFGQRVQHFEWPHGQRRAGWFQPWVVWQSYGFGFISDDLIWFEYLLGLKVLTQLLFIHALWGGQRKQRQRWKHRLSRGPLANQLTGCAIFLWNLFKPLSHTVFRCTKIAQHEAKIRSLACIHWLQGTPKGSITSPDICRCFHSVWLILRELVLYCFVWNKTNSIHISTIHISKHVQAVSPGMPSATSRRLSSKMKATEGAYVNLMAWVPKYCIIVAAAIGDSWILLLTVWNLHS